MKLEALEKAAAVQKKAYGLLLWLKDRARTNPELLSAKLSEPFQSGNACVEWVRRNCPAFPHQFRPAADEVRDFGFILSSFFSTSFRIADVRCWHKLETTLVPGAIPFRSRRHKLYAVQRQQEVAEELQRLALTALAAAEGFELTGEAFVAALVSSEIAADLTLWTYGCELVRRCEYASQGTAVHQLWLALDAKTRKNLSAASIWLARARLAQWMKTCVAA